MMRIDNSDNDVIMFYRLDFNPDDPGMTEPVDLCFRCCTWEKDILIDHPDYEDDDYFCLECGTRLTRHDN
jgi:hypothetical protein